MCSQPDEPTTSDADCEGGRDARQPHRQTPAAPDGAAAAAHVPVLLRESLGFLHINSLPAQALVVDCTVGLGGHAEAVLERHRSLRLAGIDRDVEALGRCRQRLARFGDRFVPIHGNYADLSALLDAAGLERVCANAILADLGVSSMQLDEAERGFSFRFDGPLDMRMDATATKTAADVVKRYKEEDLVRVIKEYGEERRARRIARALVERREAAPIETTGELREVVKSVSPPPRGPRRTIDPATRTFQALRIEVNQELAGLRQFMDQCLDRLDSDGRLVVISYHSLEDRIVKHSLRRQSIGEVDPTTGRERAETRLVELLTKKPVRPSEEEVERNPRARSARLRAARRL